MFIFRGGGVIECVCMICVVLFCLFFMIVVLLWFMCLLVGLVVKVLVLILENSPKLGVVKYRKSTENDFFGEFTGGSQGGWAKSCFWLIFGIWWWFLSY